MIPYVKVTFVFYTKILFGDVNTTELLDPLRVADL